MKKLGPGCNEPGWTMTIKCTGGDDSGWGGKVGCGSPLEIEKSDLYSVHKHDIAGPRNEVRFTCVCGIESLIPDGQYFTDLPNKKEWLAKRVTPQE